MNITKSTALLAALALTAGMSAACTADKPNETKSTDKATDKAAGSGTATASKTDDAKGGKGGKGGSVTIAETNTFTSLNPATAKHNMDINGKVTSATIAGLYKVTPELKVEINKEVGNIEKISDNPLKVKYTVNEKIKWSDGNPVDAGDLMLAWAYGSGFYDSYKKEGDKETGTKYFNISGSTIGLEDTKLPEIGEDGRSMTIEYSKPFADWQIALDLPSTPAHIVAKRAGLADEKALIELFKKTPKGDPAAPKDSEELKKVAKVWNEDFNFEELPKEPELYLASGPFIAKSIQKKESLTLVRNDKYGGTPAKLDEVTVRYIGDANAAIGALRNGEADIIAPQPSADTLKQLDGLASQGVKTLKGDQMAYDHIDLTIGGPFADKNVREAFMHCVPRTKIVNLAIKPMKADAKPLDSQLFVASKAEYPQVVAANGSDVFKETNVAKAKELLGGKSHEIKVMYNKGNPVRVNAYRLISESCTEAGFKMVDGGLPSGEWGKALTTGDHNASIFGWVSSGVGNGSVAQIFKTGGGGNFTKFSNKKVDELAGKLAGAVDPAEQVKIKTEVDKILFEERYGLPLFQSVGVVAHKDNIEGIVYMPASPGVWWNIDKISAK